MVSVQEVDTQQLIRETAERLKERGLEMPVWAGFVKTGRSRERPPQQENWWWIRGASLLRKVYLKRQGISKLRKAYSGRKNLGHGPEHSFLGSGKIIRVLLQQLEAEGLLRKEKGKGRVISPQGQKFLDGIAKELQKGLETKAKVVKEKERGE